MNTPDDTIEYLQLDQQTLKELKTLYTNAEAKGNNHLMFQGKELVTNYVKYLIELAEQTIL